MFAQIYLITLLFLDLVCALLFVNHYFIASFRMDNDEDTSTIIGLQHRYRKEIIENVSFNKNL